MGDTNTHMHLLWAGNTRCERTLFTPCIPRNAVCPLTSTAPCPCPVSVSSSSHSLYVPAPLSICPKDGPSHASMCEEELGD